VTLQLVQSQDGRRQRSERSQRAIIEAAVALMEEGTLIPTAQQIADRAGVGIRSLFRHFEDLEALFAAADAMLRASYEALFSASDRSGTLAERITGVSQLYGEGFDQVSQLILSTKAQLWSSPVLTER
jgi:AcrR family transcriptional regulator